MTIVVP